MLVVKPAAEEAVAMSPIASGRGTPVSGTTSAWHSLCHGCGVGVQYRLDCAPGQGRQEITLGFQEPGVQVACETSALMIVDLALELWRRAAAFEAAGDLLRAQALLRDSAEQLVAARALLPAAFAEVRDSTDARSPDAADDEFAAALEDCITQVAWVNASKHLQVATCPELKSYFVQLDVQRGIRAGCGGQDTEPQEDDDDDDDDVNVTQKSHDTSSTEAAKEGLQGVAIEICTDAVTTAPDSPSPWMEADPPVNATCAQVAPVSPAAESTCQECARRAKEGVAEEFTSPYWQSLEESSGKVRLPDSALYAKQEKQTLLGQKSSRCVSWCCGLRRRLMVGDSDGDDDLPRGYSLPGQFERLCLSRDFQRGDSCGVGSQGCVFIARHSRSGHLVAVKEVFLDRLAGFGQVGAVDSRKGLVSERMARELRLLEQLEHPCIVRYLGHEFVIGAQGGPERAFIYLEYCSGGSLASHLHKYGPLELSVLQRYTGRLVAGLFYLHSHRPPVIHRDLKCANLLLTHDSHTGATDVKITDFGCSKLLGGDRDGVREGEHSAVGSIFWMPPEVLRGKVKLPKAADIWSLGCCVVEMTTGRQPWAEKNFDNILQACHSIQESEDIPAWPQDLPEICSSFIRGCLRKSPAERLSAAELLHHRLLADVASTRTGLMPEHRTKRRA
eukprot:TRINITY_DN5552_c0_g1_i1.p1 TRINITY_DN5552_c0_g1~~TRINITY_DN5552_c0_g1_i1.p1  ORF type:complete len:673 (+),score=122.49 TRINITY_DN5552_c0_g1_i1:166-2184(+)